MIRMLSRDHDNHNWYQTSIVRTVQKEDRHKLVCLRGVQLGDSSEHSSQTLPFPKSLLYYSSFYTYHFIAFISIADLDIVKNNTIFYINHPLLP